MDIKSERKTCDGHLLKWLFAAGLAWLERHEEQVNRMNVFPVPDGDTGINMRLTMNRAYQAIAQMDEDHVGVVASHIAKGALFGARGNSGVILSQLFKGFADSIEDKTTFNTRDFARACQNAVELGYQSVGEPIEGTMLTVARESMEAIQQLVTETDNLIVTLDTLLDAARESLKHTPNILPVLKNAGVVDSGGQGLVFILEGMSRLLHGESVDTDGVGVAEAVTEDWQSALVPEDEEGYGYDVQFLMHGDALDVAKVRGDIDAMGWSTLVVGDSTLIKVHVHVHDPGQPLSYAVGTGAIIDDIVVENMQAQYEHYVQDRSEREANPQKIEGVAVITVANGDGLTAMFRDEMRAAYVLQGGQTMNPSAEDFLRAIDSIHNECIVLLPNNKNIVMSAKQAASLARDRRVKVVSSKTIPQGVNAMLAYLDTHDSDDLDDIAEAMQNNIHRVTTLEVTRATRDALMDDDLDVKEGQYIGLLNGEITTVADSVADAVKHLLDKARADEHELITLYYGADVDETQAQALLSKLESTYADQEFTLLAGGQPLYPYIISVE